MTEAEAYAVHGWPLEGDLNRLILPVTGNDLDYTAYECSCGVRYVMLTGTPKFCYMCGTCDGVRPQIIITDEGEVP